MKYIYTVTMIRDIAPESDTSKYGKILSRPRLLGWYTSPKKACEAVEMNRMDVRDNDHDYAVVERVHEGVWAGVDSEWWYKWDYDAELYVAIEKPSSIKHIINFGIG